MAFQAKLSALTGELVEALTGTSPEFLPGQFNRARESAHRRLRHHNFLRTNQFDVEARVNGLEEAFRIQHREGLADAFRERIDRLGEAPSKWHPEILYLLLELSDRPIHTTRLEDLDGLKSPEPEQTPVLKWKDIAREDNWDQEPDLWKSIDYSDDSGTDVYEEALSESDISEGSSLENAQGAARKAEDFIYAPGDDSALKEIEDAQKWRAASQLDDAAAPSRKVAISELQALREVLFMLRGLSTTLFLEDCTPNFVYQINGVSWDTYKALISSFSETGRRLLILRTFTRRSQANPHLQVFQSCISEGLRSFDAVVTGVESRLIHPEQDLVISLAAVSDDLKRPLEPLLKLSDVVEELDETNKGAFRYLELLFQEIGIAQVAGRRAVYEFLGRIFFDCFNYYLRPIKLWMQDGRLIPGDKIFFVSESTTHVPLDQVWTSQFRLRRTADGSLYAPDFLRPSAHKIFNAGKSIVILKHLGKYESRSAGGSFRTQGPLFDLDAMFAPEFELAPFSELFDAAFERWIEGQHNATSDTLKSVLFESCGLWSNLDAMKLLYFMSDGAVAGGFCASLFKKLDTPNQGWRDRYALTSLAQEVYSPVVDAHRLSVTIGQQCQRLTPATARESVRQYLPEIALKYNMRWPVQMILTEESLRGYRMVFALLLQLRRASYMINKERFVSEWEADAGRWSVRSIYYAVRSKLFWFCSTFQTYLANLVLAPGSENLRGDLNGAHDVDAMIDIHLGFMRRILNECCLGSKLEPIRECILDILDLAIQLEKAQSLNALREAEEMRESSRLSMISSPIRTPLKATPTRRSVPPRRDIDSSDDEAADGRRADFSEGPHAGGKSYRERLGELQSAFDRHLKFLVDGLRAVSRATSDPAAAKWDILAEMLETGLNGSRHHVYS